MKRVIRLTESDLTRIVKRVLNEQPQTEEVVGGIQKAKGMADKVLGMISKGFDGIGMGMGTQEETIAKAIKLIPQSGMGKEVYNQLLDMVQNGIKTKRLFGRNFDTVMDLIQTEFSKIDLRDGRSKNTIWLNSYSSILKQYNSDEVPSATSSHMEG